MVFSVEASRLEYIGGDISVFVSDSHPFGTDSILLANFCNIKRNSAVCDLGTGCGIIPLIWCRERIPGEIYGIEIQPEGIRLCERAVEYNGLSDYFHPVCADLRVLSGILPGGHFDLVTMNPPYKQAGGGVPPDSAARLTARHETAGDFGDICNAAARLLKPSGHFCICHRPERLAEVVCTLREHSLEPKRLRFVSDSPGGAPFLFLLDAAKGGRAGMNVLPALYIKENGEPSAEIREIYGDYFL